MQAQSILQQTQHPAAAACGAGTGGLDSASAGQLGWQGTQPQQSGYRGVAQQQLHSQREPHEQRITELFSEPAADTQVLTLVRRSSSAGTSTGSSGEVVSGEPGSAAVDGCCGPEQQNGAEAGATECPQAEGVSDIDVPPEHEALCGHTEGAPGVPPPVMIDSAQLCQQPASGTVASAEAATRNPASRSSSQRSATSARPSSTPGPIKAPKAAGGSARRRTQPSAAAPGARGSDGAVAGAGGAAAQTPRRSTCSASASASGRRASGVRPGGGGSGGTAESAAGEAAGLRQRVAQAELVMAALRQDLEEQIARNRDLEARVAASGAHHQQKGEPPAEAQAHQLAAAAQSPLAFADAAAEAAPSTASLPCRMSAVAAAEAQGVGAHVAGADSAVAAAELEAEQTAAGSLADPDARLQQGASNGSGAGCAAPPAPCGCSGGARCAELELQLEGLRARLLQLESMLCASPAREPPAGAPPAAAAAAAAAGAAAAGRGGDGLTARLGRAIRARETLHATLIEMSRFASGGLGPEGTAGLPMATAEAGAGPHQQGEGAAAGWQPAGACGRGARDSSPEQARASARAGSARLCDGSDAEQAAMPGPSARARGRGALEEQRARMAAVRDALREMMGLSVRGLSPPRSSRDDGSQQPGPESSQRQQRRPGEGGGGGGGMRRPWTAAVGPGALPAGAAALDWAWLERSCRGSARGLPAECLTVRGCGPAGAAAQGAEGAQPTHQPLGGVDRRPATAARRGSPQKSLVPRLDLSVIRRV